MHLKLFIEEKKQYIQHLLLSASENKLPKASESRLDLYAMCVQLQSQRNLVTPSHQALCHRWAAKSSTAEFKGTIIDHYDTIKIKFEIQVPIFSKDLNSLSTFKIINLGFFAHNQKFKLELPSTITYLDNNKIFDSSKCLESVCLISDFTPSACATCLFIEKSS